MNKNLSARFESEKTELQGTIQQLQSTVDTLTRELSSTDTELNKTKADFSDLVSLVFNLLVVCFMNRSFDI